MEKAIDHVQPIGRLINAMIIYPIPTLEKADLEFFQLQLDKWKGIQEMINESHVREEDCIIHQSWSLDIPYLCLYHTLVEDNI